MTRLRRALAFAMTIAAFGPPPASAFYGLMVTPAKKRDAGGAVSETWFEIKPETVKPILAPAGPPRGRDPAGRPARPRRSKKVASRVTRIRPRLGGHLVLTVPQTAPAKPARRRAPPGSARNSPIAALPVRPRGKGRYLSDGFGPRRAPKAGATSHHCGVDIPYPKGTPVLAAGPGIVETGVDVKAGKLVVIRHPNGYSTRYFHLNRVGVRPGQRVKAGDPIGEIGATGIVTGPHLHFEILATTTGKKIDPEPYLRELGAG